MQGAGLAIGASTMLRPIQAPTRDEAVLDTIAAFVEEAALGPGDRLPAERELAERLGVSRSTIREALKRWEGLGIVRMRKGAGVFLLRPVAKDSVHVPLMLNGSEAERLTHALEIRRLLEPEAAALCAIRASNTEIGAIEMALDISEAAFRMRDGMNAEEDWAFHQSVLRACGNPLFDQIVDGLRPLFHLFWENPLHMADFGQASFPFHRHMFEAIARRDPSAARKAALAIISSVDDDIRRGRARAGKPQL